MGPINPNSYKYGKRRTNLEENTKISNNWLNPKVEYKALNNEDKVFRDKVFNYLCD